MTDQTKQAEIDVMAVAIARARRGDEVASLKSCNALDIWAAKAAHAALAEHRAKAKPARKKPARKPAAKKGGAA